MIDLDAGTMLSLWDAFRNFGGAIMQPLYWVISGIIVLAHQLWSPLFGADSGVTWTLSIVVLTIVAVASTTLRGGRRYFADRVQVLQVEALCWCGRKATHNARIIDGVMVVEGEQVVVGDTAAATTGLVEYEVLCRRHYMRRMNSHSARAAARDADILPFDLDICPVPPTA